MNNKVTIRDVAKAAGVSPSTVSRAFSMPGRVSPATTKRIFQVADELGYHEIPVESRPSSGHKGLVAIIVPDMTNQFFSDIVRSVQQECARQGMGLLVSESCESASMERVAFDRAVYYADGVILASSRMPDSMIRKCAQVKPVVVTNRVIRGVSSVITDVSQGMKQTAAHLKGLGFDRLTYLDGPAHSWSAGMCWNELTQACAEEGLKIKRFWPGVPTYEGGFQMARDYLKNPTGAVVAYNDMMALGFIAAMRKNGYECPRDYSIIGIDDDIVGRLAWPALTSIHRSTRLLGSQAARTLLARFTNGDVGTPVQSTPTRLVIRESTGPRSS
ncbi:LacI family DNA-binding transcriptional regulator [Bifidobacterium callimiconis]|uniref:LacI family transcriptional regulator n=1 Tax=Bifidobacterium callimiconis TaxID=2306973 RepID=A0A430FGA6_9BIFI|nr:LacI family DNA-binding transcriptional regulator [Bifidobacterium callimiconis]RSX51903.1 LacI family transcriptional regulator [Bifidobacterium callimiconis]